ncbi:MAG: MATE family efflux transporter [Clostridia bacterium]|nr:MATE family efflux transporter [Clostridia bacterium]
MEKTKDLTEGKIIKGLVNFAIPIFFALVLQSLYGAVDLMIVGQFAETSDVSGVSTGGLLMQTFTMIIVGLAMGVTILIAQCIGKKERENAGKAVGTSLCFFTVIGIVLSLVLGIFSRSFTYMLSTPVEAVEQTNMYIKICGLGMLFIVAYNVLGAIFRGIGDSRTPLLTVGISCVLNILGDLLFVAVFKMGASGAALATVLSQGISVIVSLVIIVKKELPFDFGRSYIRFDKEIVSEELKLGIPIALQEFLVGISFMVIQVVANSFDVVSSAGVGIGDKVCAFIMLVPSAYMQAIATFVAQNLAAQKPNRVKSAMKFAIISSLVTGTLIGAFSFFKGDLLTAIFAKEPNVIEAGFLYLKGYAIDCILVSLLFCLIGYFNGRGNTVFVMLQGVIGAIAIRVPVTFLMSALPETSLFLIGLATPCASLVQIILCLIYLKFSKPSINA